MESAQEQIIPTEVIVITMISAKVEKIEKVMSLAKDSWWVKFNCLSDYLQIETRYPFRVGDEVKINIERKVHANP